VGRRLPEFFSFLRSQSPEIVCLFFGFVCLRADVSSSCLKTDITVGIPRVMPVARTNQKISQHDELVA